MPEYRTEDVRQFESSATNVGTIFATSQKLYKIPILQRRYVWEEDDVNSLFEDIEENFAKDASSNYFIGAMVFAKDKDRRRLLVIDGQQRLTTFVLLITAVRDLYRIKGDDTRERYHQGRLSTKKARQSQAAVQYVDEFFLESNDKDKKFFEAILRGTDGSDMKPENPFEKSMLDAKIWADRFVARLDGEGKLDQYMEYVYNCVYTAFTEANDKRSAFRVFMTLNSRGVALEPEDLIKALLLSRVVEERVVSYEDEWNKIIDRLISRRKYIVAIPTFLKHYLMSIGVYKSKDEIYDWFEEKYESADEEKVGLCMTELQEASDLYARLYANEAKLSHLETINAMNFRQAYVVLMASGRISEDIRRTEKEISDQISENMARLAIEQAILKLRTNEFEDLFTRVAGRISSGRDSVDDLKRIVEELNDEVEKRRELTLNALESFICETKSDERKIAHILQKMAHALDGNDYSRYTLEHIAPQERVSGWNHIPENEYDDLAASFGNLALLSNSENTSAGTQEFDAKRSIYKNCSCRLTKSIAADIAETGTLNTRFDKAIRVLNYASMPEGVAWDAHSVIARAARMRVLADFVVFGHEPIIVQSSLGA
ncbi:MAG: DUF262 domain-containing HNH endonuclease family protein [Candidatus Thermoplasmatota archaeon]